MRGLKVENERELNDCKAIRKAVFVDEQGVPERLEWDEYDENPQACHHWLALDDDGRPAGTARWREYEPGTAKLQRIAVLPAYRGKSVGRLLVSSMEGEARALGCAKAVLDAQCSAEMFYRKLGYATISGEPFYDADILHVRMEKSLV